MIKRTLQSITAMLLIIMPGLTFGSEADLKNSGIVGQPE